MTGEKGRQTTKSDDILARLVRNYVELSARPIRERASRTATASGSAEEG